MARDGYLHRAAEALDNKPKAIPDEYTYRGLLERHPESDAPRKSLSALKDRADARRETVTPAPAPWNLKVVLVTI